MGRAGRIAAGGIAAIAWAGLIVQCVASYHMGLSVLLTLWIVLGYFTILTNLLGALVFTAVAAGSTTARSNGVVAGTMLASLLVGVVYVLLLHGMTELSGGSAVANVILHMVTPILVPVFWIVFVRKGGLKWRHPLLWALYPLAYLPYALIRGAMTGRYAYPFLDVRKIGWEQTAINAVAIALGFMLCGFAVLWIDRRAGRRSISRA